MDSSLRHSIVVPVLKRRTPPIQRKRKIVGIKKLMNSSIRRPEKPSVMDRSKSAASRTLENTSCIFGLRILHTSFSAPSPTPPPFTPLTAPNVSCPTGSSTWTSFRPHGVCPFWKAVPSVSRAQTPPSLLHLSLPSTLGSVERQSSFSLPHPVHGQISNDIFVNNMNN